MMFVHELLDRQGIVHWVDYGTLLGAVRGGEFIAWDSDVDFGILADDASRVLALTKEIEAAGHVVDLGDPAVIRVRYSEINEQHLDLFLWTEADGQLHSTMDPEFDWQGIRSNSFSTRFIERLEPVTLYDKSLPAPSPRHEFLVDHRYGADYMVPTRAPNSMWLYPQLSPEEMTATVNGLLASVVEKDHRLAELNLRSRFSRIRAWEAWRNAGRPLAPPVRYIEAARDGVPPAERSEKVEQLVYAIAALDHAIDELEHPRPMDPARRMYRRAIGGMDMVMAKRQGRPRRVFGKR